MQLPNPEKMSRAQLTAFIQNLQSLLYIDPSGLNPDKEWNADTLEGLGHAFQAHGLAPRLTVEAEASVDGYYLLIVAYDIMSLRLGNVSKLRGPFASTKSRREALSKLLAHSQPEDVTLNITDLQIEGGLLRRTRSWVWSGGLDLPDEG